MLILQQVSLNIADLNLLDNVDLKLESGERVFILGRNGMGKSSLLKLLASETKPDSGRIEMKNNWKLGYLPQDVQAQHEGTVFSIVASGLADLQLLFENYHAAIEASTPNLNLISQLQEQMEAKQAWEAQHRIETVISKLDLCPEASFANLSGGVKRRVLLARALVVQPDVLLLDEPTNHLDIESIRWLEEYLLNYKGCLVVVSHDRSFMERLATRIIEIDRGKFYSYPGTYNDFLKLKASDIASEQAANARFDKKLAEEEQWIRQGVKARRTRNEGRVRALEQMRRDRAQRRDLTKNPSFSINKTDEVSGEQVILAHKISYAIQNKPIIQDFSLKICRGDKIGIIGPNGCGKTTLLNLLLGKLQPDSGTVKQGTKLSIAYFDQLRAEIKPELSVRENLAQGSDKIIVNGKSKHVVSYLQDFLFSSKQIGMPTANLSGGQFNRLLLAKMFTQPANLLVLDEPTNDLDIETLELLEDLLTAFQGTLLIVSHDRQFLNQVITSSLVFLGEAKVGEFVGGYDDYLRQAPAKEIIKEIKKVEVQPVVKAKTKLSYQEQKELEKLPLLIEKLEKQIAAVHQKMGESDFYQQDPQSIQQAQIELAAFETELELAFERWEILLK